MTEYSFLNSKMDPPTGISSIYLVRQNGLPQDPKYNGTPIRPFPSDHVEHCVIQIDNKPHLFLVGAVKVKHSISHYRVYYISSVENGKLEFKGGDAAYLTEARHTYLKDHILRSPVIKPIAVEPSFKTHIVVWMLVMGLQYVCSLSIMQNSFANMAQAVFIDTCAMCFNSQQLDLKRVGVIVAGMSGMNQLLRAVCPAYTLLHPIMWLIGFHYWPTLGMIVSGAILLIRVGNVGIMYARYAGILVYTALFVSLGIMHVYYQKLFLPCFAVVSMGITLLHLLPAGTAEAAVGQV